MRQESFSQKFKALSSGISVHSSSKTASLHPIFHNGLIKVGGEICHANIPEESKHQVILSKYHYGTQLILRSIHENNLHVDREHTLVISRQRYWILSCRSMIRNMLRNRVKCRNERTTPQNNRMGDVPKERVSTGNKSFLMPVKITLDCNILK